MKDEDHKSAEIEAWEMPPPKKSGKESAPINSIMRTSYREPVEGDEPTVSVNETSYDLMDIGSRGIGISLEKADELTPGETYPVTVQFHGKTLQFLGRVVHVSPEPAKYICGIELTNLGPDEEKSLQEFLQNIHAMIFAGKKLK